MVKAIDFDTFLNWAQSRFDDIIVKNEKIRLNSIYCDDTKHHLWCRPYTGFFHCYKSGKKEPLHKLIMDVEKCSYSEAVNILGGDQSIRCLEEKLEEFLNGKPPEEKKTLSLPPLVFPIKDLTSPYKEKALRYLETRLIPPSGLYFGVGGDFYGRIVIPYYDSDGELIYFNGRDILNPKPFLRYRGPDAETGFRKDQAVWMSFFPRKGAKIYLTEGEFDAMTLSLCGLHGCATGGKDVQPAQIDLIRKYEVCLAFDTDPSGKEAFRKLGWTLYENGIKKVSFVRPPKPFKDWNEMFVAIKGDEKILKAYITKHEKPFNEFTSAMLNF